MSGCRTLVIAHGRSELIFCRGLASNYRLEIAFDSEDNGNRCIQMSGLRGRLSSDVYRTEYDLHKEYPVLEYLEHKTVKMPRLRIFPIMDTDDSRLYEKRYRTGEMFTASTFKDRITPIYNSPNLDAVLRECGFNTDHNNMGTYHKLVKEVNEMGLRGFIDRLSECNRTETNLPVFLEHCRSVCRAKHRLK